MNAVDRLLERQPLVGQERRQVAAVLGPDPLDADLDLEQRIRRRDRPVGTHREPCAGAEQRRERVLPRRPLRAQERDRELVHLRLAAGPQRLGVPDRAEAGEARHVVGMDDLDVGEVRPRVGHAVRGPGCLDRVERVPDRPVAERMEVRLEPGRIEPGHDAREGRLDR